MCDEKQIHQILDFAVHLGREMLESGANLERVSITMQRISKCYKLREVSMTVVNSVLFLSVQDDNGINYVRQEPIPVYGIH